MNYREHESSQRNVLRQARRADRRGSVLGLVAVLLPVLVILAAFCINAAQMQLTRTELMVATDAAAKAGGRALSEMQTVSAAKSAAEITAALNTVQGAPLRLQTADDANEIEFGRTTQPNGPFGRYVFEKIPTSAVESGVESASAVRVRGRREGGSLSGRVPLLLPGLLSINEFETVQDAVAMQVDRDISLVLDRSGSMADMNFNWPPGQSPWGRAALNAGVRSGLLTRHRGNYYYNPGVDANTYQQWAWQNVFGNGNPPNRPWDDLVAAVNAFLSVLDETSQEEQVSIASYSSSATLDTYLQKDFEVVRNKVARLSTGGMTAIGLGMQEGIQAFLDASTRPHAAKTMVVMTDGIHNTGVRPDTVARQLVSSYNLTIHTVTFGENADQQLMRVVAGIGGGNHYHAATGVELVAVFQEIANNLPTILTD